nr:hypothetical protein [Tanacetum cinerariifolium]
PNFACCGGFVESGLQERYGLTETEEGVAGKAYTQKMEEENQIEEEQAAKGRYWKILVYYDDDDDDEDYTVAITHKEPDNSLSIGDEHLDTISAT